MNKNMTEEQLKKVEDLFDKKKELDDAKKSLDYSMTDYEKYKDSGNTSYFRDIQVGGNVELRDLLDVDEYYNVLNYIIKTVSEKREKICAECNSYILSKKVND